MNFPRFGTEKGTHAGPRGSHRHVALGALRLLIIAASLATNAGASELHIGAASVDITPTLPVALCGQFNLRIATTAETPLTANVLALESREQDRTLDLAIMVSCDLVGIPDEMLKMVRQEVRRQLPEVDTRKLFLNATHTHTAPVLDNAPGSSFLYPIPKDGVLQPEEYVRFFVGRVSGAIVEAWNTRRPGSVTWGLSHAVVACNRRTVYSQRLPTPGAFGDGTARMYGDTRVPEFRNLEGMEDHDLNVLFFWDEAGKLSATIVHVPCTAQLVEGRSSVNADYWHPVREKLRQRFGPELVVLGVIGAAGDQSPRPLYRGAAEERMTRLRGLSGLDEIARRIVVAVEEAYNTVKEDRHADAPLIHKVDILSLPLRLVTQDEYAFSKAEQDKYAAQIAADPKSADDVLTRMTWNRHVVERFERQQNTPHPQRDVELHVLRIGDATICTCEFELFTDYGIRIQARSKALQTLVVQLVGNGSYLPTEKAVQGGGYSAVIQSTEIGPEGGQMLVDRTVALIDGLFPSTK
ncbi:MAG: hypothetical protein BWX48_01011 [Verrucomicrobia bacterium ADurb.Bin006]|nr:MAG: hypothetical protein BWX48_01011 [Verrucomicrobia bacterium ADurb.Bin006]HOF48498.1 hypothetical protein [Verrucomicrobiota bacterium]